MAICGKVLGLCEANDPGGGFRIQFFRVKHEIVKSRIIPVNLMVVVNIRVSGPVAGFDLCTCSLMRDGLLCGGARDALIQGCNQPDMKKRYLGLFYSSFLMLIIALLNYVSLSTAIATTRRKDIAIRKIFGASSLEIAALFIVEMLLLVSLAYILSIGLAAIISPYFGSLTGEDFVIVSAQRLPGPDRF